MKPGPLTVRAMRNVMTVHTPTHVPNSTASQPGWTVLVLSHGMVAYSSGREARGYASVDHTFGDELEDGHGEAIHPGAHTV
jgi:hypothetical protein